jgi:hypothetical protein
MIDMRDHKVMCLHLKCKEFFSKSKRSGGSANRLILDVAKKYSPKI